MKYLATEVNEKVAEHFHEVRGNNLKNIRLRLFKDVTQFSEVHVQLLETQVDGFSCQKPGGILKCPRSFRCLSISMCYILCKSKIHLDDPTP